MQKMETARPPERQLNFTLKQLRYFVAAGEAGSIRKASDTINVSQPSISAAISHLEDSFNLQLFVRHHAQGLSLTPAGRSVLLEAKLLLSHGSELQNLATELSSSISGTHEFACFNPLAPFLIPDVIHAFARQYPGVRINIHEGDQAAIIELLKQGDATLALTYDMDLPEEFTFVPLAELPPYVVLGAGHPLARHRSLHIEQLIDEPLILLDMPISREYFMSIFIQRGLKPNILTRTAQSEVMRGLVAQGQGYALANVRPRNRATLTGAPLVYVPLEGGTAALTLGIAMLDGLRLSRLATTFIDYCRNTVKTGQVPGMVFDDE